MKLNAWLSQSGIRQEDFAKLVGVRQPVVSLLASGKRTPRIELALKIEKVTKGAVGVADWAKEPEAKAASPQRMAAE